MKRSAILILGICVVVAGQVLAFAGTPASTQALSSEELAQIIFEQKLGQQVSPGLEFRDERGNRVKLSDYFGTKPIIVVPGYYGCPMLCSMVLNGLVETLQDMKWKVGDEFEIINFSINPRETSQLAAAKKRLYLKRYGRTGADQGWHFLTGDEAQVRQLADEIGFRYAFDPVSKEYAHPSGFVVLTPKGRVSRYFFGVSHMPGELYNSLREAGLNQTGSPIQQLFYLCFHYNPIRGKYGGVIMAVLRVAGFGTVAGLSCLVYFMVRAERRRQNDPAQPARFTIAPTAPALRQDSSSQPAP